MKRVLSGRGLKRRAEGGFRYCVRTSRLERSFKLDRVLESSFPLVRLTQIQLNKT